MSNHNAISIAATEASHHAKDKYTLHEQLIIAMECTKNHWMVTDEDDQFTAAVAAVYLIASPEDQKLLADEMKMIRKVNAALNALQQGVKVDMGSIDAYAKPPIGLMDLWHRVKEGKVKGKGKTKP